MFCVPNSSHHEILHFSVLLHSYSAISVLGIENVKSTNSAISVMGIEMYLGDSVIGSETVIGVFCDLCDWNLNNVSDEWMDRLID